MISNVFRYDKDNDGSITYDELVRTKIFRQTFVSNSILEKWLFKDYIKMVCIKEVKKE